MDDRDVFDRMWDRLAERGFCDARFSAEYERCRGGWDSGAGAFAAALYIRTFANTPPDASPPIPERIQ